MTPPVKQEVIDRCLAVYEKHGGNLRKAAKELGISRSTLRRRLEKTGKVKKPIAAGSVVGLEARTAKLPTKGGVKRYILTSAQNNTHVHAAVWDSLQALAKFYDATIMVGTFTYNQNAFGKLSVKRGTVKDRDNDLWYDPKVVPFIVDQRHELAKGLLWCGEMNILPTAAKPLTGLESYSARSSAIFPHVKMAMRSVPTMLGEGTKLNYTTGTVTQRNYIQKREGLVAEHHHVYGGVLVEVNSNGNWWVRQLNADNDGTIQDLNVKVQDGKITKNNTVEAITWGDLHAGMVDEVVLDASLNMLDALKPREQFLHDVLEGASINRHVTKVGAKNMPHYAFHRWLRGLHKVDEEFRLAAEVIRKFIRTGSKIICPDSNHDGWWLHSWLARFDYRVDPANAELFLDLQKYYYAEMRKGLMPRDIDMMGYTFSKFNLSSKDIRFLLPDESYTICNKKIECGMHGHLGPNGTFGTPENLSKMGRKSNTAHTHCAGIYNGLYVAGTTSKLKWTYNWGPSGWTHSHIVTYPNGKRTIITIFNGAWRAE